MDYLALFGIAVGLSMDAFAVALTNGAVTRNLKLKHALGIALAFGAFQAVRIGIAGRGIIESVDHWVAFILLGYIGGKMVYDAVKEAKSHEPKECRDPISFKMLMVMAIATSIDALATGIILPSVVGASTLLLMLTAVGLIGLTTFIISFAGVYIGKKFGDLFSSKAELLGGLVLIIIGCKILIEHLFLS